MDLGGTFRCEGITEEGQEFVRFVSIPSGSSALAQFRASCNVEGLDLLRVNIYRCNVKSNRVGKLLVTWEKPR